MKNREVLHFFLKTEKSQQTTWKREHMNTKNTALKLIVRPPVILKEN